MRPSRRAHTVDPFLQSCSASTGLDDGDSPLQLSRRLVRNKRKDPDFLAPSRAPFDRRHSKRLKKEDGSALVVDSSNDSLIADGNAAATDQEMEDVRLDGEGIGDAQTPPTLGTGPGSDSELSVEEIVAALESQDPSRQQLAANAIRGMAKFERHRKDLAEAGVLYLLIKLLDAEKVDLLRHVVGALWNLGVNIYNNREIVTLGAVPALVKNLRHPEIRIQRVCAGAIRCLAWKHDINRTEIATAGGVAALVELSSSQNYDVQVQAVASLWNLGLNTAVSEIITNEGAVKVMVRMAASDSLELQRLSAGVLRCLAYMYEPNRVNIANEGGIKHLVRLLSSPNIKVQQQAAAALGNLTYRNGPNRITVVTDGGVERLIAILQSKSAEVQLMAATTLRNLALNEENRIALGRGGAIPALIPLLDALKTDVLVQVAAALWNLSLNDQNKGIFYRCGGVDRLYALYRSSNSDVVYYAKGALFALGVEIERPQQ